MKKKNKQPQIIFFNNNDMKCYTLNNLKITNDLPEITSIYDYERYNSGQIIEAFVNTSCSGEIGDKIELDNVTMKKIAKYNAEKDVELLIRKKKVIEDEIKQLQEQKKIEEQKFKQLSKFANKFLNAEEHTIEDYIHQNITIVDRDYDY